MKVEVKIGRDAPGGYSGNYAGWSIGSCKTNYWTSYEANKISTTECCLKPGVNYELTCKNSRGFGWDGGYIEIHGKRYCDKPFFGEFEDEVWEVKNQVTIEGIDIRKRYMYLHV